MDLDDVLFLWDKIKVYLKNVIFDDIFDWGIILKIVEIQDINLFGIMQMVMEEQAVVEWVCCVMVICVDGDKQVVILEVEG